MRGEHPHPGRNRARMQQHALQRQSRHTVRAALPRQQSLHPLEDQGISHLQVRRPQPRRNRFGKPKRRPQHSYRNQKSGNRACDANVKKRRPRPDGRSNPYERSQSSEQRWRRDKKWQRCPHAIALAIKIVTHLVGQQNQHQRRRETARPASGRDQGCPKTHCIGNNGRESSSSENAGLPTIKLACIRAPTTSVVKHVSSSSNACSQ